MSRICFGLLLTQSEEECISPETNGKTLTEHTVPGNGVLSRMRKLPNTVAQQFFVVAEIESRIPERL